MDDGIAFLGYWEGDKFKQDRRVVSTEGCSPTICAQVVKSRGFIWIMEETEDAE